MHTPILGPRHLSIIRRRALVVPLAPVRTPTRIGQRSQTWRSDAGYRIGSPNVITVSGPQLTLSSLADDRLEINDQTGKKIKRRLEDLERRAGSSSTSPEPAHAELPSSNQQRPKVDSVKRQKSRNGPSGRGRRPSPEPAQLQYSRIESEQPELFRCQYSRDLSTSPPPSYPFSYPLANSPVHPPYSQHGSFQGLPAPAPDFAGHSLYLPPIPVTLPSISPYELGPIKSENPFEEEGMISHFNMGYPPMTGMDAGGPYQDSNPHVSAPKELDYVL